MSLFIINFAAEVGLAAAVLTYKINRAGAACIVGSAIGGYSTLSLSIFSLACLPCVVLRFSTALWLTSLPPASIPLSISNSRVVVDDYWGRAFNQARERLEGEIT